MVDAAQLCIAVSYIVPTKMSTDCDKLNEANYCNFTSS